MLKCESCWEEKEDVSEVVDPYDQEINGKETMVCLCADCYRASLDDI